MSDSSIVQDGGEAPRLETDREAPSASPEELQKENARLRLELAERDAGENVRAHPWRRVGVATLVVIGCLLLFLANLAFWLKHTTLSSNGWLAAVGPLSQNEVVVDAVSTYVVDQLFTQLQVEDMTSDIIPPKYAALSGTVSALLKNLATLATAAVIESDAFRDVWLQLNRTAHSAVVETLRGEGSVLYLRDGNVTLDLTDMFDSVQDALGLPELGLLTEEDTTLVLFSDERLASLQRWVAMIDVMGFLLPLLTIIVFGVAWWWSLFRRRTALWIGGGIVVTMLLQVPLVAMARPLVLSGVQDPLLRTIADEVWASVTSTLTQQTVLVIIVGLVIAFGAWFAGPNRWAVEARTDLRNWWSAARNPAQA